MRGKHRIYVFLMLTVTGILAMRVLGEAIAEPSRPTPTPTAAPALRLGSWAELMGLAVRADRYETTSHCRGAGEGPAPGAKLLYVWLSVRNTTDGVIDSPSLVVELSGVAKHDGWFGGTVCRYDDHALGNACHKRDKLYPGVQCEGWVLFEVPAGMQVEGATATVSVHVYGKGIFPVGRWSLSGQ